MDEEQQKRRAAIHGARWIGEDAVVGLGTGSTVRHLLDVIAEGRREGRWLGIRCVPTSRQTEEVARQLEIPLVSLDEEPVLDVTIDGADEVDQRLDLIKGRGGALLREKIVAAASRLRVIIADASKEVAKLGTRMPLPVEVDPFGAAIQPDFLRSLGAIPELRRTANGVPFVSDGGNYILDCRFPDGIDDAAALERELNNRPGIVENGLFVGLADHVVVASNDEIRVLSRAGASV